MRAPYGSFDKLLFPTLQVRYLVAPTDLVEPLLRARGLLPNPPSLSEQAVLADFIRCGALLHHTRRTRPPYQERQKTLMAPCRQRLGDTLELQPAQSGL